MHKVREAWEGRNCQLLLHQQCAGLVKVDAACFLVRPPTHNHRCFEVLAGLPVKGGTATAKAVGKEGAFFQTQEDNELLETSPKGLQGRVDDRPIRRPP